MSDKTFVATGRLMLVMILSDYAAMSLLDSLVQALNSDKPDTYEWALTHLKKFGEIRKEEADSGYLTERYKNVMRFLNSISFNDGYDQKDTEATK